MPVERPVDPMTPIFVPCGYSLSYTNINRREMSIQGFIAIVMFDDNPLPYVLCRPAVVTTPLSAALIPNEDGRAISIP